MLNYNIFNLYRTPCNDQSSSNTQISMTSTSSVENVSNDSVPVTMSPIAKRVKITYPTNQDDTDLAQPLITTNQNITETDILYYNINTHKLNISISPLKNNLVQHNIVGRRILDLVYICTQIKEKDNHDPYGCSFKDMVCINEINIGLKSSFTFLYNFCHKKYTIDSENPKANMTDINIAAVAGIMNIGGGYSQLQCMTVSLEIPPLGQFIYNKSHDIVCKSFEELAMKEIETAAKEEAKLAISAGDIDTDGTPLISVVADSS